MIAGIGIDAVAIERFGHWHRFSKKKLQRIYSADEIEYCLQNVLISAERFAVRFAAREALYKALSTVANKKINFFVLLKATQINFSDAGVPKLTINWQKLVCYLDSTQSFYVFLSLSHTKDLAIAQVIVEFI